MVFVLHEFGSWYRNLILAMSIMEPQLDHNQQITTHCSSITMLADNQSPPMPPNFSGQSTPRKPSSPAFSQTYSHGATE